MRSKPSLNVSLTEHLEQFVLGSVASGRYQSASEVVRAALRLLEQFENSSAQSTVGDGQSAVGVPLVKIKRATRRRSSAQEPADA